MRLKSVVIVGALVAAGLVYLDHKLGPWSVELPDYSSTATNQWASQGWNNDERHWFHHDVSQGTNTFGIPYEWFIALEQPEFLPFGKLLADQNYLARFGFIPSPVSLDDKESAKKLGYTEATEPSPDRSDSRRQLNKAGLPVGFAVSGAAYDPVTQNDLPIHGNEEDGNTRKAHNLGLTCPACHTGQLEYGNHRILIDGGASMISLDKFGEALEISLKYTALSAKFLAWDILPAGFNKSLPTRFNRFARRVIGEEAYRNPTNWTRFRKQFFVVAGRLKAQADLDAKTKAEAPSQAVDEGFARLDALNRIGNEVFQVQMNIPENSHPITGPVSFPHIWTAPWFDWVQYNSSIMQPMVRNLGEAMGVKGAVNLVDNHSPQTYDASHIPIEHLHQMELQLRGKEHPLAAKKFGGLQSPKWKDLPLPKLDETKVAQGRKLYMESCVHCHLPPLDSKEIFADQYWKAPTAELGPDSPEAKEFQALLKAAGSKEQKFLALKTLPVLDIGTDCRAAYDMVYRNVSTPNFIGSSGIALRSFAALAIPAPAGCGTMTPAPDRRDGYRLTNFGVALGEVVYKTKQHYYKVNNFSPKQRLDYDGDRPNGIRATVASNYPYTQPPLKKQPQLPVYKARPLNGVWTTAPFLHNGSVPNLYLLLSPQEERDREAATFWVGSRQFDPKYVGYAYRTDSGSALTDLARLKDDKGLFKLDTRIAGNRNTGHLFTRDHPKAKGSVWRELNPDERFAIIEFLKSL